MKIVSLILICLISLPLYAEKIRIWHKPGELIRHIACSPSVSFDQCVADYLEATPILSTYTSEDVDRSSLPTEDGRAWEWDDSAKKIKVNQSKLNEIEVKKRKKIEDKQNARNKLKGLGFTDDEIDAL